MTDFDPVASFYYPLSLVFLGTAPQKAQEHFIHLIKPGSRILIVGGGNGEILKKLQSMSPPVGQIDFVESSSQMMKKAQKTAGNLENIRWISSPIERHVKDVKVSYDVVLTGFFFDLFPKKKAEELHHLISGCLAPSGSWIDTDFQLSATSPSWQKAMLKTMYHFFKKNSNVKTSCLPDLRTQWQTNFTLMSDKTFYRNFIITRLWKKSDRC